MAVIASFRSFQVNLIPEHFSQAKCQIKSELLQFILGFFYDFFYFWLDAL